MVVNMNNIGKLIKAKTISFNDMLVRYYHRLGLSEQEAMIIMLLYIQQDEESSILSTSNLLPKVSMSEDELAGNILKLVQRGYIEIIVNNSGKESFSLDLIFDKLGNLLEGNDKEEKSSARDVQNIVAYCESSYQKTLSTNDLIIINHWFDEGYQEADIKQAVLDSLKAKKMHLKYADAILANRNKKRTPVAEVDEDLKTMLESLYVKH